MKQPAGRSSETQSARLLHRAPWLLLGLLLPWTGCRLLRETAAVPQRTVQAVAPGTKPAETPDPATLQQRLMRFADDAINRISRTVNEYIGSPERTTPEVIVGMQARLAWSRNLVGLATSSNPNVALVDLVSMVTLTRLSLEAYVAQRPDGKTFVPMLQATSILETNAWELSADVFKPAQQQELRSTIEAWYRSNADPTLSIYTRPQEFAAGVRQALAREPERAGGFFSLLTLDPMVGLDPAVREVAQTRLFAERALFAGQQLPRLLHWEIELLTLQLSNQPEVQMLLSNSTSLAASVDRASRVAENLPDRLSREREAVLRELEQQEGKLTALTAEIKQSLVAGEQMSTSLNTTLTTFDALMKRFGVGEPRQGPPPNPDARPFDIRDYGNAAQEFTAMAQELDVVLKDLNTTLNSSALDARLRAVNDVSRQTADDVRGLLNHAFLLAAGLVVLCFTCALGYRALRRKPPGG